MTPLVSVVLPVYNGAAFLSEALDSLFAQTFTDYELIVIDDGSTDRTSEILQQVQDSRLTVYRHAQNQGLVAALNSGWQQASGSYIAIMNADDVCLPERLAQQTAFLNRHPDVGLLGTATEAINHAGEFQRLNLSLTQPGVIGWELFFKCPLAHPTVMIRRSLLVQTGGYRQERRYAEDYDLWTKIAPLTRMANLPDVLLRYRVWPETITARNRQPMEIQSTLICQEIVSRGLDRDISLRDAAILRRLHHRDAGEAPATPDDVRRATAVLLELHRRYLKSTSLTRPEQQQVAASVARKLLVLAHYALSVDRRQAWGLFVTAVQTKPDKLHMIARAWNKRRARKRYLRERSSS